MDGVEAQGDEAPDEGSITGWLVSLRSCDELATEAIWSRFKDRVSALARRRIGGGSTGIVDDDDIAQSVFNALFRGLREGRFARLDNRQDLWQILAMITVRKSSDAVRRRDRNREGALLDEPLARSHIDEQLGLSDADFATLLSETSVEFLGCLEPKLRRVALLRLEGRDQAEIARLMDRSRATIERYFRMIRIRWSERLSIGG